MSVAASDLDAFVLTDEEKESVRRSFSKISYDPKGSLGYISDIRTAAYKHFPPRLIKHLENQKHSDVSFSVFENLPVDQVYGSPLNDANSRDYKDGCLSENVIVAFGSVIAEPYSIYFEGKNIVNNLVPHPVAKNDFTGIGSAVDLDFHTENAAQAYDECGDISPVGLLLSGVRGDPNNIGMGPKTLLSDARKALNLISDKDINILYSKSFFIKDPYRWRGKYFGDRSDNKDVFLRPVLKGPIDHPHVTVAFYPDMVQPVGPEAEQAYSNFHDAIKRVSIGIDIEPGRLVYVNNRFTLHSREKFNATQDENGSPYRWVQRVFVTNNLWNFRSFTRYGDRVYDPSTHTPTTLQLEVMQ